jgi:hypothetical protein
MPVFTVGVRTAVCNFFECESFPSGPAELGGGVGFASEGESRAGVELAALASTPARLSRGCGRQGLVASM